MEKDNNDLQVMLIGNKGASTIGFGSEGVPDYLYDKIVNTVYELAKEFIEYFGGDTE